MDFIQRMRLFQRAAETHSFSAVARELDTTQPTVSKQIALLERELDARLFVRTTGGLRLTDAGQQFYERARGLLDELASLRMTLGREPGQPTGRLRVSCATSFGQSFIAPLLLDLVERHPALSVELLLSDRWFDVLEEGIDVAIRIGPLPDARIVAHKLGSSSQVCVAAPGYLKAKGEPTHARELADHRCLVNVFLSPDDRWSFSGPDGSTAVQVQGNFRTNNIETIRAAVVAGNGIAVGAVWLYYDDIVAGRVIPILRSFVPAPLDIHALHAPGVRQPAKVTELVKILAQRIPQIKELGAPPHRRRPSSK
ncbi:MAG: LysR family transcriptional regulator [Betaproteobacteria bacterium]